MSDRLKFELGLTTLILAVWTGIILLAVLYPWWVLFSLWVGLAVVFSILYHFFHRETSYLGFLPTLLMALVLPLGGLWGLSHIPRHLCEWCDTPKPRWRNYGERL